jgi:hypothetical protein
MCRDRAASSKTPSSLPTGTPDGVKEVKPFPAWGNQLIWALLKKRNPLILSVVPPNEAATIRGLAGEAEYMDVREVDALRSLVVYSPSTEGFGNTIEAVDIALRSRRRTAASRTGATRRLSATSAASRLTTLGAVLVICVAALGGVSASVVMSFGPYCEYSLSCHMGHTNRLATGVLTTTIWAIGWPILRLKGVVQCKLPCGTDSCGNLQVCRRMRLHATCRHMGSIRRSVCSGAQLVLRSA